MPRPPSIRLRLSRLLAKNMQRLEFALEADPLKVLDLKESQMVLNMAKADALIRDRSTSREEEEDSEQTEQQRQEKAKALVKQLVSGPAAMVSRSGDDDDSEP